MSRAERLLDLVQLLRRHRRPVSGRKLADELGVSIRTLYRDIVTLQGQGAPIEGEPGLGYVLKPGFMLPPLMFGEDEIEALLLGSRWVADRADGPLALAARDAMAKIVAVLPPDLGRRVEDAVLILGPGRMVEAGEAVDLSIVRRTIRSASRALAKPARSRRRSPSTTPSWMRCTRSASTRCRCRSRRSASGAR